jgi:Ca2+-transporting ATPase
VTVALALGARRMARRRALIRKLPAVETLGSVTVICSDKTGTLTQNRMLVQRVWTPTGSYQIGGDGYAPAGAVGGEDGAAPATDDRLSRLGAVAAACNDAVLEPPPGRDGHWQLTGDPTEGALLALAGKLGSTREGLEHARPRVAEVAFDAARRRMTTMHRDEDGVWAATKGALDALLPCCGPPRPRGRAPSSGDGGRLGIPGHRVLALADRHLPEVPDPVETAESDLRLLGLVAMADPARPESAEAVAACRTAGIVPVMITGDDARTATAIAERVGIVDPDSGVLTGAELGRLDDDALTKRAPATRVYARTSPEQKLRIIDAWKRQGAVVAMAGDGVNDAPALRRADIGVAIGVTGIDVSKEAADMVLADDNFATIVAAVQEGRRIYDNIRRFVRYLLTTNSGEVLVMFLASVLALPVPLLPVQILWINLVTDGLPAIALGLEPAERDTMRRRPRSPTESIFARGLWQHALWVGLTMAVVCLAVLVWARAMGWPWQTIVFTTLALLQLGHALAVRSERESFFTLGARSNPLLLAAVAGTLTVQLLIVYVPVLQVVFDTEPLSPVQLAVVLAASTVAFIAVEIEKWVRRRTPS